MPPFMYFDIFNLPSEGLKVQMFNRFKVIPD